MERTYLRIGLIPLAGMLALAAVGCPWDLGPAPPTYTVHGTAAGITEPISVRLALDDGEELLTIRSDGPFVFEALLHEGEAYAVSLVGSPPCDIVGAAGVVGDSDPDVAVQCGAALVSLSSLSLLGAVPALGFSPGQLEYAVDVPGFQQSIAVLARTANPSAIIGLNGMQVTSGEPVPIRLPVGEEDIEIAIAHPKGLQRSYRISARRAAKLAQHVYAKASNGREYDEFGFCMAMDGNLLAVGTIGEDSAATGIDGDQQNQGASFSGAVYVFRRDGISWTQEAYLKASNTGAEDGFGCGIALSGDTLAVGAGREDSAAKGIDGDQSSERATDSGAVYVFRRRDTGWVQEAYIKASNTQIEDSFGSVALDGDLLAVGATGEDSAATGVNGDQQDNGSQNSGAVYVFRRTGGRWSQEAYIKASNPENDDRFGISVAVSGDTLAVGATGEDSASPLINGDQSDNSAYESGAVYVFRHADGTWKQEAYVKGSRSAGIGNAWFGHQVALERDTLMVAAPWDGIWAPQTGDAPEDEPMINMDNSGSVYVFRRTGTTWAEEAYLQGSNTEANDTFGSSIALHGNTLAVSALGEGSRATGIDGDQADNSLMSSGAVYIFRKTGSSWVQESYVKASNTDAVDWFGWSVAVSDDTLAVSAAFEDSASRGMHGNEQNDGAVDSGAVYVFH